MDLLSLLLAAFGVTLFVIAFVVGVIKSARSEWGVRSMSTHPRVAARRRGPSVSDHTRFLEEYVRCPWAGCERQSRERREEDTEVDYGSPDFFDRGEM